MSKTKIINFLVALKHEALPIIDYFELTLNEKNIGIFLAMRKRIFFLLLQVWEYKMLKKRLLN